MEFAQRLRDLREDTEPHLTQEELGIRINISQRKISRLERGDFEPNLKVIKDICNYYNISADFMLGLTDEPRPLR